MVHRRSRAKPVSPFKLYKENFCTEKKIQRGKKEKKVKSSLLENQQNLAKASSSPLLLVPTAPPPPSSIVPLRRGSSRAQRPPMAFGFVPLVIASGFARA